MREAEGSDFISHSLSQHPAVHNPKTPTWATAFLHTVHAVYVHARACICMCKHEYTRTQEWWQTHARERARSQTRGSPPFCTTSWKLGTASDVLVSPGSRGGERESRGGSRGAKSTNPEERDAKRVTLASFQDSAGWDTYICQSSREGNASPTFTGASPELCLNPLTPSLPTSLPSDFRFFQSVYQHP
jgi:hypothetical protein